MGSIYCWQIDPKRVDSSNGTIINYVGFFGPADGSDLCFGARGLGVGGGALGVLRAAEGSEAAYEKSKVTNPKVEIYTQEDLQKDLEQAEIELKSLKGTLLPERISHLEFLVKKLKKQ